MVSFARIWPTALAVVLVSGVATSVLPSLANAQGAPESCDAETESVGVSITMPFIEAIQTTSDDGGGARDRDEIYINVGPLNSRSIRLITKRLPVTTEPDDYYGFFNGQVSSSDEPLSWGNQADDQRPFFPQIFEGQFGIGARGSWSVNIREQDGFEGPISNGPDDFIGVVDVSLSHEPFTSGRGGRLGATFSLREGDTIWEIDNLDRRRVSQAINIDGALEASYEARGDSGAIYRFGVRAEQLCLPIEPTPDGPVIQEPVRNVLQIDDFQRATECCPSSGNLGQVAA